MITLAHSHVTMLNMTEELELENVAIVVGESRRDTIKTAVKHFDKFLDFLHKKDPVANPLTKFSEICRDNLEHVTSALIGFFADYLRKVANIKALNTCLGYLSCVKVELGNLFPSLERDQFAGKWYSAVRKKITAQYAQDSKANGTRLVNSAAPMAERDLIKLNELLFLRNDREADMNRCLFTWQWHTLARISEISSLRYSMLNVHVSRQIQNALTVMISRLKTSVESDINVFIHADSYEVCPFHALATMTVTNSPTDALFKQVSQGSESQYVNRVLAQLVEQLSHDPSIHHKLSKLLSHSTRSGGATFANEHADIQTSWIVLRGGWTLEGMQTIFNYLCGTMKTDASVGRVLSGWASAGSGGNCPSIECIPEEDRELFRMYCATLLASASVDLQYPLMCSLLLHWDEVERVSPKHFLLVRMRGVIGVSSEHIGRWVLAVRRAFRNMNAPFLPVNQFEPTDSVPYATIEQFFGKTIEHLNLVRTQLSEESIKREESDRRARESAEKLSRMERLIESLVNRGKSIDSSKCLLHWCSSLLLLPSGSISLQPCSRISLL